MGTVADDLLLAMSDDEHDELDEYSPQARQQPRYLANVVRGKACNFYINGDLFFPGRKIVYNPRHFKDFPHYLDFLTAKLDPRFGAVRKIHTPCHGHRVQQLSDIQENRTYVVAGNERFRYHSYDQITPSERKKSPPFTYDADPVSHSRMFQSSGKIQKIETQSILIKVWPNGSDLRGPRRVLLTPRVRPFNLTNILKHVNEMLKEDCLGTVEKLYFLNGIKVRDEGQITQNGEYVACRKNERYRQMRYREFGTKNIATSPRLERKYLAPLGSRSTNTTENSSPEHSNASTQNSVNGHNRRKVPRREEDQVFPAKPVKHTRSSEKVRTVDLDKDEGGVFKAKHNNRTTRGAREVQETRHTRTDLPVDYREAREVEDERIDGPAEPRKEERQRPPPQRQQVPRGGVEAKANSKRAPPPGKHAPDRRQEKEKHRAATKIQANYRGYRSRKQMQTRRQAQNSRHRVNGAWDDGPNDVTDQKARDEEARRELASRERRKKLADEEMAATKIQAGIRGHNTRKRDAEMRKIQAEEQARARELSEEKSRQRAEAEKKYEEEMAAVKLQAGVRGHQARQRLRREEEAATKIQSGYRGHEARRSAGRNNEDEENERLAMEEAAATKIQAGYRGHKVRQQSNVGPPVSSSSPAGGIADREDSYDELDREHAAATTIQSQYRGYRARQKYRSHRAAANK